ncbi:MAG: response regulator, partial [bacterium]|nr:response regulator [bacterium]
LDTQLGLGSTFKVLLENVDIVFTHTRTEADENADKDFVSFKKASLLIVDEIPANRELIKKFLYTPVFTFHEACNGKEAIEMSRKYRPDVVFMDMKMPVMDGYEATGKLKADDALKSIPVIALTANALKEQEKEVRNAGCDGYLRKPINRKSLMVELMRFLPFSIKSRGAVPGTEDAENQNQDALAFADTKSGLLEPDIKIKLPKLLGTLKGRLTENWNEINNTFFVDEIETFAVEIEELGEQYNLEILTLWGQLLMDQVRSFDMDKIPGTLKGFPGLIDQIEHTILNEEPNHEG